MHSDEFEHPYPKWRLARRSLGISSFGMNIAEIPPGEQIPEHDEADRDQEEVFVVLSGAPTIVIDGRGHAAPTGTYARVDPDRKRTVVNDGDEPASVLIISAPRSSGYQAPDWA
jgi:uncharacterized cupin superfamily protein